jgi:hypothetical protein
MFHRVWGYYQRVSDIMEVKITESSGLRDLGWPFGHFARGSHSIVKLNTTCETILLPLYYMA